MSKVRSVLLAAVAAVAFGSFANPTIVAWENDFSTLKKDNITLDLQGNAVDGDGGVTIGSKGIKLTRADNGFAGGASNAAVTVIVEASNITAGALGGIAYSATTDATARRNADGILSTHWGETETGTSTKTLTGAGPHRLAFVCGNAGAQKRGLSVIVDGEEWTSGPSYFSSSSKIVGVVVGGNLAGTSVAAGMKVSRVAVVDGVLTPEEVASYVWPSARNGYYDHFKANFSDRVISMTAKGSQSIYSFTGTLFDLETLADTAKTYNGGTETTDLPGYTGETKRSTWNMFCRTQLGYVAPGCVMRIPPCDPGKTWQCKQEINDMTISGLIVEEGAVGTKIVDLMIVPGDPVGYVASSARAATFGDASGSVPSWFILKESFLADNIGSTATLFGELNFDIADGRVLHFQTVGTPTAVTMNTGTHATLKMHGAGTIKLQTLTATGDVGLDYSDLPLDRETPYIDGSITINASTRITLPAGADGEAFYRLCSGVVTASALPASIKVGDADVTDYSLVGNKIVFSETTEWTGAGADENWTTAENWSDGLPTPSIIACFPLGKTAVLEDLSTLDGLFVVGGGGWEINGAVSVTTVDVGVMAAAGIGGARILRCTAAEKPAITVVNGDGYRAFWHGDWLCVTSASDETLARYARWADYGPKIWTWKSSGDLNAELHLFDPVLGCRTGETNPVATKWHVFCDNSAWPTEFEPGAIFRMEASFGLTGKMTWGISPSAMGGFIIEPGATDHELSCTATDNRTSYLGDYKGKTGETWSIIDEDFVNSHGTANIGIYGVCNFEIAEGKTFTLRSAQPAVAANATLKMHGAGTLKVEDRTTPAATPPENAGLLQAVSNAGLDYSDLPADRATPYIDGGIVIDATTKITIPAAMADGGRFMLCSGAVVAKGLPASIRVGEEEVTDFALVGNEIVIGTTRWTNATGDNNWSTAENWSNGLPGEGSVVIFGAKDHVNVESADAFTGVAVAGRGWTIDGAVSTTTIDFAGLTGATQVGTGLFRCTADEKPSFTAVNLGDKFRMTWNGDILIATLATVTDEALAYYRPWADCKPNAYTWVTPKELGSAARYFDPLLGCETGESYKGSAWGVFCANRPEYETNSIFRLAPGSYSKGTGWSMTPFCVGGFIVEPGALGAEILSTASDRETHLGDYEKKGGETWSRIDETFTLAHGRALTDFYGLFNLEIAEGKVFTVKSAEPTVAPGATLKMHGAGTLKVEDRDDPKATPPEDAGFLKAVANAGLDFSDLALDRAAPFIDGNLKVDATTRFAFPADLAENTPYPLCTGTLRAPTDSVMTRILLGDEEKIAFLSFADKAVRYRLGDSVAARIGSTFYDTVQAAFDAADATSTIDVIKDGAVTLTANKAIKSLNTFGNVTISGAGALTLAADGSLNVGEGLTVTVNTPLVLAGVVRKLGAGAVSVNGSVDPADPETYDTGTKDKEGKTIWDYPYDRQQFAVCAGTADFDGAIRTVTIRGCGTDAANWPVITLKANCTVSDLAAVSPVRYYPATGDASVKYYGMVVQNGARYTYDAPLGLMGPNWGEGKYVLNSGTLTVTGTLNLQYESYRDGQMTFEMNGGEVTATDFNICRTGTSDNDLYRGLLVMNDGCLSIGNIKGTANSKDGHWYVGWQEHKRIELNGGTFNIRNNALLYSTNIVWVVASGDITLANNAGTTTVVPDCLAGMDSLTFAGAGTLDVSGLPAGTCDDYRVTGGALLLGEGNVSETTTLKASGSGKFGLEFEGVRDIKTYFVGNRQKTIGYEYGVNAHGAARFVETDPAGAVRLLEGKEPTGAMFLVR